MSLPESRPLSSLPDASRVLANRETVVQLFQEDLKKRKTNIVILTTAAGAGHWRQAERIARFFESLGLNITFVATNRTTGKPTSSVDRIFRLYSLLQKYPFLYGIVKLSEILMNSPLGAELIDRNLQAMAKQGEIDIEKALKESETFDETKPTIFITTHSMLAGGVYNILKKRKNSGDWVIEFVPDPWKGGNLRSMTFPNGEVDQWITVVHDEETAKEYKRIWPDSRSIVLPWGTVSNYVYLERREELKTTEAQKSERLDVFIECSGNYIPTYDRKITEFIRRNAEAIKKGKIRIVIEPMHHKKSYDAFLATLKEVGLENNPNILLLPCAAGMGEAVLRRENVLEGIDNKVNEYFNNSFNPFAVIAKGGEVPLEDRADMIVFSPFASVPHETEDIKAGVREGRTFDARKIHPSQWLSELDRLFKKEKRELPEPSMAILAPAIIYLLEHPEAIK